MKLKPLDNPEQITKEATTRKRRGEKQRKPNQQTEDIKLEQTF